MVSAMQQFCAGESKSSSFVFQQMANDSYMNDPADRMNLFFSSNFNFDFYFDETI